MTKKTEPSEAYLKTLELDLASASERFATGKRLLYEVTATAKLGEPAFENARRMCLDANKDIVRIETEMTKVRRALEGRQL